MLRGSESFIGLEPAELEELPWEIEVHEQEGRATIRFNKDIFQSSAEAESNAFFMNLILPEAIRAMARSVAKGPGMLAQDEWAPFKTWLAVHGVVDEPDDDSSPDEQEQWCRQVANAFCQRFAFTTKLKELRLSKPWHYAVTRRGHSGSLAYRHLARTTFEMYLRHGASSLVMLIPDMGTWGDLSEQLTSRQDVAHHRGYILAANALYLRDGKMVRGAAGRVKSIKKRKPSEKTGRGAAGRLAIAVRRLSRTYDTHALSTAQMISVLPREFNSFAEKAQAPSST